MARLATIVVRSLALACVLPWGGCRKVPLVEQQGFFDVATVHWFGNENVAYVFFSAVEDPELLEQSFWQIRYRLRTPQGGTEIHDWERIDFNRGVHKHQTVPCGAKRLCGSFSFATSQPPTLMTVRLNYHPDGSLYLEHEASVHAHPAGTSEDAHSAFLYGVWDETNEHVEARVYNNFGVPGDEEVASYGMTRRFRIRGPALADPSAEELTAARALGSPFLFTPAFCTPDTTSAAVAEFSGRGRWLAERFDPGGGDQGVCFTGDFLDKNATTLFTGTGYARKNPEIGPVNYTFRTPLTDATQIKIVLRYCQDDAQAPQVTRREFFDYQKYILDAASDEDVCFRIGDEREFQDAFERHLATRLSAAKQTGAAGDFVFVVLFHQNLSQEFRRFHQIIAEALTTAIDAEAERVSPRLVGAFVYDSRVDFRPTAAQRRVILWCPQEATPEDLLRDPQAAGLNNNCTVLPTRNFDLEVINFVTPMGPFPSLADYEEYVDEFGDRGLAKGPRLSFSSVPAGPNTRQEDGMHVTFHDGERIVLEEGEKIRLCLDRDGSGILWNLRFRTAADMPESVPSLGIEAVQALWLSDTAQGVYRVGTAWDFPFVGMVTYTSVLTGNIVSVIPFQRSSKSREILGDSKWTITRWNVGDYMQVCRRFCDHPYFDEAGIYQVSSTWQSAFDASCPAFVYPTYDPARAGMEEAS